MRIRPTLLTFGIALAGLLPAQPPPTFSLGVGVGKSILVDSPVNIQRVSVADSQVAEAVAVNPREVLINGKGPGETTLILWQQGGNRLVYEVTVSASQHRLNAVQEQLRGELAGQDVTLTLEDGSVFLRGTVNDLVSAERAVAIAATLGKVINLLHVKVPGVEPQILLKVRFANVDRAASSELGANLLSTGALNMPGRITTGQFSPPQVTVDNNQTQFSLGDALNVFLFRRDLDLGATIRALQSRRLLQILAEPNVLAINGKPASFVAGGEFPFPTLQGGGAGLGAVTIQFREFGVRINFLPTVTPRGSIRLNVVPEVSSLDFANGLVFQGFNIPALATRRVQTEVELESGQSFAIAGMLDNRLTETMSKIPGLSSVPLLGKLFQSRATSKNNSELLVMVTPELVRPIPAGRPRPEIEMPLPFLEGPGQPPRTPGIESTGPVPTEPRQETVPVEELKKAEKGSPSAQGSGMPPIQLIPVPVSPAPAQPANPGLSSPPEGGQAASR